ncbi:glycosyltransferase [Dankookia rubra]|uniref:Glycosyltransferase n=1 Tax=Dankookia rubra TaxID=1442381 RepID=A0A4R5QP76_9PROT|nr:glycosyltransferase [Dankookia rubra]TDH64589.1 glycosyltransferase [Dankookia rubra]
MRIVVFGLTITSSWGNGHATLWRALCRALARRGHHVTFFERDVPYYADTRDLQPMPGLKTVLYADWSSIRPQAERILRGADIAMVTSYCPDGAAASALVLNSAVRLRTFYDLDTPVTLDRLAAGERPDYLPSEGLGGFDLVLSYTGGEALQRLRSELGARRVAPLYGSVDLEAHRPVPPDPRLRADLSYLGTYAADRQPALERLFVAPARALPAHRFVIGGALYPPEFPWAENIWFLRHMPPAEHAAFFASSRLTLNITRRAMAAMGWCPSGRLFEAAACGAPILTDSWAGLADFYTPGGEVIVADTSEDAIAAIGLTDAEMRRIARAARDRTLAEHTADHRAIALEDAVQAAMTSAMIGD